jgi:ribonuclease Z
MKRKITLFGICLVVAVAMTVVYTAGWHNGSTGQRNALVNEAQAAGKGATPKLSPTKPLPMHDVYYPGTEALGPDEMRVTACGTGQPSVRPKQAAACWLVELGNGDKFLFDIGAQSHSRISAMKIPYDFLDKVFIGHLHLDHMADLPSLWIGGLKGNRTYPLRVWGPSGSKPELGTKYAMEHMRKMYTWEVASATGKLDDRGLQIEAHEFDFKGVNKVIYQENGVTIRSIPAIHVLDGSVSFILEWNGLKFAYSSDTSPNKWWIKHTKGADIVVHECFAAPEIMIDKQNYPPPFALQLSTLIHTAPAQFGKIMAETKPRMAVGYHFYNDHDTMPAQLEDVRKTYDGPMVMAKDYMVFNITKDNIRVRMAAIDEDIWPLPPTRPWQVDRNQKGGTMSDFTKSGDYFMKDLLQKVWGDVNKKYGSNAKLPAGSFGSPQ